MISINLQPSRGDTNDVTVDLAVKVLIHERHVSRFRRGLLIIRQVQRLGLAS